MILKIYMGISCYVEHMEAWKPWHDKVCDI